VPGMRRVSNGVFATPPKSALPSPVKTREAPGNEGTDTRSLLERMKETVDVMKKRRESVDSRSPAVGTSPTKRHDPRESVHGGFSLFALDLKEEEGEGGERNPFEDEDRMDVDRVAGRMEDGDENRCDDLSTTAVNNGASDEVNTVNLRRVNHTPAPPTSAPKAVMTPSFKGMKEMFAAQKIMQTPVFEGIGEMLKTPDGYRHIPQEEDADMEEVAPVQQAPRAKATSRKVTAGAKRKMPRSGSVAEVTVEETPNNHDDNSSRVVRRGRSGSKQPESDAELVDSDMSSAKLRGRIPRGGNKKAVEGIAEVGVCPACIFDILTPSITCSYRRRRNQLSQTCWLSQGRKVKGQ
jgi:hypothetical protein